MNKGIKLIIALVVVGAVAAGAVFLTGRDSGSNDGSNSNGNNSEQGGSESDAPTSVTITYDGNGFSPAEVTVASGGTVNIKNDSDEEVEPSSDPHPTHTTNPELNAGDIEPGGSATLTVTEQGSWGYHNHYDSSQTGTVIVE